MIIHALLAQDAVVEFRGEQIRLRRPTVADLIAAQDAESRGAFMPAWYVANHLLGPDGRNQFANPDELRAMSAPAVVALSRLIEPLYLEGLDLQAPPAKS